MANIAISFWICSPIYLNKAFLVLNFKFSAQNGTFILQQFEGTDFKFDTHSYSSRNIQTKCVGPNNKITIIRRRYFIFINLQLLISNLSITFWNSYSNKILKSLKFRLFYKKVHSWFFDKLKFRFLDVSRANFQILIFPSISFIDMDKIETWRI